MESDDGLTEQPQVPHPRVVHKEEIEEVVIRFKVWAVEKIGTTNLRYMETGICGKHSIKIDWVFLREHFETPAKRFLGYLVLHAFRHYFLVHAFRKYLVLHALRKHLVLCAFRKYPILHAVCKCMRNA